MRPFYQQSSSIPIRNNALKTRLIFFTTTLTPTARRIKQRAPKSRTQSGIENKSEIQRKGGEKEEREEKINTINRGDKDGKTKRKKEDRRIEGERKKREGEKVGSKKEDI